MTSNIYKGLLNKQLDAYTAQRRKIEKKEKHATQTIFGLSTRRIRFYPNRSLSSCSLIFMVSLINWVILHHLPSLSSICSTIFSGVSSCSISSFSSVFSISHISHTNSVCSGVSSSPQYQHSLSPDLRILYL